MQDNTYALLLKYVATGQMDPNLDLDFGPVKLGARALS